MLSQTGLLQDIDLKGRDLLELDDYTTEEIQYLIDLAIELKRKQKNGEEYQPLKGKTIGLILKNHPPVPGYRSRWGRSSSEPTRSF